MVGPPAKGIRFGLWQQLNVGGFIIVFPSVIPSASVAIINICLKLGSVLLAG